MRLTQPADYWLIAFVSLLVNTLMKLCTFDWLMYVGTLDKIGCAKLVFPRVAVSGCGVRRV